ncbi:MAG: hypothetical protein Q4B60_08470 [Erysipelotrichaceae bacterium]|nr:hypothetical protein [Erysipelotrichaceae bacterium]
MNKDLKKFILVIGIYLLGIVGLICGTNYFVDASSTINPKHDKMAKLALEGNVISLPENYNHRVFQRCIVDNMETLPSAIVIGSSRGMYLGKDITGIEDIYNNCVGGASIEDYFGLLGLYQNKFNELPETIIIEVSPWVFYKDNPENRWIEDKEYKNACIDFYKEVTGNTLKINKNLEKENPYLSLSYFRYNVEQLLKQGTAVFEEVAKVSDSLEEMVDNPDGTIRYRYALENESEERLEIVKNISGPCTYQNSDKMIKVDEKIAESFENLIDYLLKQGKELILYVQPFSVTQCEYALEQNLNPAYPLVYDYLVNLASEKEIPLKGNFDPRVYGIGDEYFIDFMHLDKKGTAITWND